MEDSGRGGRVALEFHRASVTDPDDRRADHHRDSRLGEPQCHGRGAGSLIQHEAHFELRGDPERRLDVVGLVGEHPERDFSREQPAQRPPGFPFKGVLSRPDQGVPEVEDHALPGGAPARRLAARRRVPYRRFAERGRYRHLLGQQGGLRGPGELHDRPRAADQQPRIGSQICRCDSGLKPQRSQVLREPVRGAHLGDDRFVGLAAQADEAPALSRGGAEQGLRVNETGSDDHPLGRDHLGALGKLDSRANGGDLPVLDEDGRPRQDLAGSGVDFAADDRYRLRGGEHRQQPQRERGGNQAAERTWHYQPSGTTLPKTLYPVSRLKTSTPSTKTRITRLS